MGLCQQFARYHHIDVHLSSLTTLSLVAGYCLKLHQDHHLYMSNCCIYVLNVVEKGQRVSNIFTYIYLYEFKRHYLLRHINSKLQGDNIMLIFETTWIRSRSSFLAWCLFYARKKANLRDSSGTIGEENRERTLCSSRSNFINTKP